MNCIFIVRRKISIQFYEVVLSDYISFIFSVEVMFNVFIIILTAYSFYLKRYLTLDLNDLVKEKKNPHGYLETTYTVIVIF